MQQHFFKLSSLAASIASIAVPMAQQDAAAQTVNMANDANAGMGQPALKLSYGLGQAPVVQENWAQPSTQAALIPEATRCSAQLGIAQTTMSVSARELRLMDAFARQNLRQIKVLTNYTDIAADGQTPVRISMQLLDNDGVAVQGDVNVTVNATDGRLQMPCRLTPETGPDAADRSKADRGAQALAKNGRLDFVLLAPSKPGTVTIQVIAGGVTSQHSIVFVPDLRDMDAVGLTELKLHVNKKSRLELDAVRENDAFEKEIKQVSRDFKDGRGSVGLRSALFLKGKIKGDALLTLSYDSEKEPKGKLFKDVNPNDYYPVYGDSSIKGNEAQSADKLYIRIDKNRSYILYGDFVTHQNNQTFRTPRELGAYNRTLTGFRAHYDDKTAAFDGFYAYDSTKQVVDEYPGRGVSGPYTLSTSNAIANSEKVDIITRDRFSPSLVLKIESLQRFIDYDLDPFMGRLVFRRPIPSLDADFNLVSIRVTYEIEQGVAKHKVAGLGGAVQLTPSLSAGVSTVSDRNPNAALKVSSLALAYQLDANTLLTLERAKSQSMASLVPVAGAAAAASGAGTGQIAPSGMLDGDAYKFELKHTSKDFSARLLAAKSDNTFYNPSASVGTGRTEYGANIRVNLTAAVALRMDVTKSEDTLAGGKRTQADLATSYKFSEFWVGEIGVKRVQEAGTSLVLGAGQSGTGYGAGYGVASTGITTGSAVATTGVNIADSRLFGNNVDYTGVRAKLSHKPSDKSHVFGEIEQDAAHHRRLLTLGGDVRVGEDGTKVYGRVERGMDWYADGTQFKSGTLARVGIDSPFLGGNVYNEYRMRSAISGQEGELAYGLRNTVKVSENWRAGGNLEYTKALSELSSNAVAVGLSNEYVGDPLRKFGSRVEFRTDKSSRNWLSTLSYAQKLDRDWTMLMKNFYTARTPKEGDLGQSMQDRAQLGVAYRPVDNNRWNMLGRYEYKIERTAGAPDTDSDVARRVHILGTHWDYHPSRPWWWNGRYAMKSVNERLPGNPNAAYTAQLFSGRVMYDVTDTWSIGAMAAYMAGKDPAYQGSKQWATGIELGFVAAENVWLTVGYNWRGFNDKDAALGAGNYTNQGVNFGLRFKFDETLFDARNPDVNKVLVPSNPAGRTAPVL